MATLARMLVSWVDDHREVRDQTGLTGTFEVALEWTPDRVSPVPLDAPVEVGRAVAVIDPNGPSLFTAVQEQLGLKLQPKKDQADVLVIDHVEQPTPD
jgi:bla regulator protein blaR1